jgi:hypothetical protein
MYGWIKLITSYLPSKDIVKSFLTTKFDKAAFHSLTTFNGILQGDIFIPQEKLLVLYLITIRLLVSLSGIVYFNVVIVERIIFTEFFAFRGAVV